MLLDTAQPDMPETALADGHFQVAAYGVALLTASLE